MWEEDSFYIFCGQWYGSGRIFENAQGSQIAQVDVYEAVFEAGNSFVDVTKAQYIHVDSKRARDAEIVLRYKENEQW